MITSCCYKESIQVYFGATALSYAENDLPIMGCPGCNEVVDHNAPSTEEVQAYRDAKDIENRKRWEAWASRL